MDAPLDGKSEEHVGGGDSHQGVSSAAIAGVLALVWYFQRGSPVLTSMATTMHCAPNFSAASRTNSGRCTAAVLIDTLSAPASSSFRISSTCRTPPPTVSGMKHCSAVRLTTSKMVSRFSWLAVMSRNVNSSAPWLS